MPEELIPKSANFHKKLYDYIVKMIREEKLTLRQMYLRYERARRTLAARRCRSPTRCRRNGGSRRPRRLHGDRSR